MFILKSELDELQNRGCEEGDHCLSCKHSKCVTCSNTQIHQLGHVVKHKEYKTICTLNVPCDNFKVEVDNENDG